MINFNFEVACNIEVFKHWIKYWQVQKYIKEKKIQIQKIQILNPF